MIRLRLATPAVVLLLCGPFAEAAVKPHALFTDNMVLQRGTGTSVFGTGTPGEEVEVRLTMPNQVAERRTQVGEDGKWKAILPELSAGGPGTLVISGKAGKVELKNVLVGDVWICSGQSNMEWSLNGTFQPEQAISSSTNANIRLFTVPKKPALLPQAEVVGSWAECNPQTVPSFSAVGYYFGRDLQKALSIPIGLIHTSWGGTPAEAWTSRGSLDAQKELAHYVTAQDNFRKTYDPEKAQAAYEAAFAKWKEDAAKARKEGKPVPRAPSPAGINPHTPSCLYNGMIAPLVEFNITGAVWYQGESNAGRAFEYRTLMPTMIADWRTQWKKELPFFMVQLAPFMAIKQEPMESAWAELREAQLLTTTKLPKVGIAVITDVGDEKDIHPRKKEPVGARLALAARGIAYGEKIVFSGPVYKEMKTDGSAVILSFDHVGSGLEVKGETLSGFTIAGPDKVFHNAEAKINGSQVIVSSDKVKEPVAVRFGWANFPVVNLWNKDGLPATPFRTDDWPGITHPSRKPAPKK